ncbi:GerMN domain-containing protein [Treponema sp. OMZ 840]|uniref:GerMN domain-containing protein n=1 Tax=Treponema sp. OMZ 840 TaxID=244313 RepID=UPI003D8E32BB
MIDFNYVISQYKRIPLNKIHRILSVCAIFSFVLSFTLYLIFYPGTKKLLLFESLDKNGVYAENCFIPRKPVQSSLMYFTEELLAGPKNDRYRPLFPAGTKILSFFKGKDGTLYINLNGEALLQKRTSSETAAACKLLEQNIQKNYNSADNIMIAILGHKVYEYTD